MKTDKSGDSWKQQPLQVLENSFWPDEKEYVSGLVKRCHEYRKIPVGQLTPEQLRTLIGQQIGLPHLIPIAIEILTADILTEGDFYPGDLLEAVLKVKTNFWVSHPGLRSQVAALVQSNMDKINDENISPGDFG
jgi:hypothetical protein